MTVGEVAQALRAPRAALAKVFQQLVRAGLASARAASAAATAWPGRARDLTVLDVLHAFEPPRPPGRCLLEARGDGACGPARKLSACGGSSTRSTSCSRCTFASVTLATLARRTTGISRVK